MMTPPEKPFLWSDCAALGISEFTLRRWMRDGVVRRLLTGVYVAATIPDSLALRAQCAALVLPLGAVVCDRSAAWLWGIDVHDPAERFTVPDLEVVVPPRHPRIRRRGVVGLERDLEPGEVTETHGVRLTTPVRTAVDLACLRGRWRALAALDAFMRHAALTDLELRRQLQRFGGRRGVSQARELVSLATPLAESPGESWTRGAIEDAGLPRPEPQFEIRAGGVLMARLDLAYPHLRIAVEYDGEEFHGEEQREDDEKRRRWLREQGWHVIVVRKHQFKAEELGAWIDELAMVIAERTESGPRRYARRPEPWHRA